MALPLSPFRQDEKIFVTPLIGDVLFSELRDCTRINIPEYGTPHPKPDKWPDHKLVYVAEEKEGGRDQMYRFFYAADRANQDQYNAAYGVRTIQGREFKSCTRVYVTPRADFDPDSPAFGDAMPEDSTYVLYDKQQGKIGEKELDSLYVIEERNYVESSFLNSPLSYTTARPSLIPEKFQATVPTKVTEELAEGTISQPVLAGDEFRKTESQINDGLKRVETQERSALTDSVTLTGERAYVEGTKATVSETYDPDDVQTAEEGLYVVESQVESLGDGSSVLTSVKVDSWPTLSGSEWNDEINGPVVSTRQFVAPATGGPTEKNTTYQPVNKDRSLKIVEEVPTEYLNSYMLSIPTRVDIQVPDILESVSIIWSESLSEGDGESTGEVEVHDPNTSYKAQGSVDNSTSTSLELTPSLTYQIRKVWGNDLPAVAKFFFLPIINGGVSESQLLTRLGVSKWPVFRPSSTTLLLQGIKLRVEARAGYAKTQVTAVQEDGSLATSYSVSKSETSETAGSLVLNTVTLPYTINGSINLSGSTSESRYVQARAKAKLTGSVTGESLVTESYTGTASVSPAFIPATSPSTVPVGGSYLIQSRIEPYKWGYAKCSAIVFDASNLQ